MGVLIFGDHSGSGNGEDAARRALQGFGVDICPPSQPEVWCSMDSSLLPQTALSTAYCKLGECLFGDIKEQVPLTQMEEILNHTTIIIIIYIMLCYVVYVLHYIQIHNLYIHTYTSILYYVKSCIVICRNA